MTPTEPETGLDRRRLLILAAMGLTVPANARAAEEPITLWWEDLVPANEELGTFYSTLKELGLLKIGDNKNPWAIQPPAAMVRDYDGKTVRVPGFIIPTEFEGVNVTEGLLVPYVGACIHVPPPPANQIVYIKLKEAKDEASLWDPVWATGTFETKAIETYLADVGYFMSDAELVAYEG